MTEAFQPLAADERELVLGWLAFYRGALDRKCTGLEVNQLVQRSAEPSALSLLGLVRHLGEMERSYVHFPLRGGSLELRYCSDNPEGDIEGLGVQDCQPSMAAWQADCTLSDQLIADSDFAAVAPGNGMTVRWNLMKLLGEYARHVGHADILRERIDGTTGE